jgi:hypothetical protein
MYSRPMGVMRAPIKSIGTTMDTMNVYRGRLRIRYSIRKQLAPSSLESPLVFPPG